MEKRNMDVKVKSKRTKMLKSQEYRNCQKLLSQE